LIVPRRYHRFHLASSLTITRLYNLQDNPVILVLLTCQIMPSIITRQSSTKNRDDMRVFFSNGGRFFIESHPLPERKRKRKTKTGQAYLKHAHIYISIDHPNIMSNSFFLTRSVVTIMLRPTE